MNARHRLAVLRIAASTCLVIGHALVVPATALASEAGVLGSSAVESIPLLAEAPGRDELGRGSQAHVALGGVAAPLAQTSSTYSITLPAETSLTMGDQTSVLPFTVINDAGSGGSIDSVKIGVPPALYWVSTATVAPDGWQVTQIKNAGKGQAWVHFEAITTTTAIEPGENVTFALIVAGNQLGVFPASDQDVTDTLDFVTVEGGDTFARSGPLPGWERKALAISLLASPSSAGIGQSVTLAMDVSNRSSFTQTTIVPTTTLVSGSGGVTLAAGLAPSELSLPPGEAGSFTWTYTATVPGDVTFTNAVSNSLASSDSEQSNMVLIGDFTAALSLEPTQVIGGQAVTVDMNVQNNASTAITDVTPSALGPLGTATTTLASGPSPTSLGSLASGATTQFRWVYTATGDIGGTFQFTGTASTGTGALSNETVSAEGVIRKYSVYVAPRYAAIGSYTQAFVYDVANNGGLPVELVEFTLPRDFAYDPGNASGGYGGDWDVTKDGDGNPRLIRFEAPTVPDDAIPVGAQGTFTITFAGLPAQAADYLFPVRIVDTGGAQTMESVIVTITEYDVAIDASPSSGVYADGVSTSLITATVTFSGSVQSGLTVYFQTTRGSLEWESGVTDGSGVVTTSLTAPQSYEDTTALVTASCHGVRDEVVIYYVGSYHLTVSTVGDGSVTKEPDQAGYQYGQVVTLTATADPGWTFDNWSGDLTGSDLSVTMTIYSNHVVTATFVEFGQLPAVGLTVIKSTEDPVTPAAPVTFTAVAEDGTGYTWDVTGETAFSIEAGAGGSWVGNVYIVGETGTWTVTAQYEGLTSTTTLLVESHRVFLPLVLRAH